MLFEVGGDLFAGLHLDASGHGGSPDNGASGVNRHPFSRCHRAAVLRSKQQDGLVQQAVGGLHGDSALAALEFRGSGGVVGAGLPAGAKRDGFDGVLFWHVC